MWKRGVRWWQRLELQSSSGRRLPHNLHSLAAIGPCALCLTGVQALFAVKTMLLFSSDRRIRHGAAPRCPVAHPPALVPWRGPHHYLSVILLWSAVWRVLGPFVAICTPRTCTVFNRALSAVIMLQPRWSPPGRPRRDRRLTGAVVAGTHPTESREVLPFGSDGVCGLLVFGQKFHQISGGKPCPITFGVTVVIGRGVLHLWRRYNTSASVPHPGRAERCCGPRLGELSGGKWMVGDRPSLNGMGGPPTGTGLVLSPSDNSFCSSGSRALTAALRARARRRR